MSEPDFLSTSRIAIAGLGIMGGSLALALRDSCRSLLAYDPDPDTISLALHNKIVDHASSIPAEIFPQADVIILAAPLNAILDLIQDLPNLHPGSPIVFDIGSSKVEVVRALDGLPARFDPFGGHPMCGKEIAGLENADPSIFQGAVFALTALPRTSRKARMFANQLALALGSQALWLDPQTHDRWTAATSHLPYLVAAALSSSTPPDSAPLVGPGFRSTTRVAATPASTMLDVLVTNREYILESLNEFRQALDIMEGYLSKGDYQSLKTDLDLSAAHQRELLGGSDSGRAV
ncbi:MAG: prephenate dehydrogenase/arogenate dehydrogenase family protein [Anaerolineales bacterium]